MSQLRASLLELGVGVGSEKAVCDSRERLNISVVPGCCNVHVAVCSGDIHWSRVILPCFGSSENQHFPPMLSRRTIT